MRVSENCFTFVNRKKNPKLGPFPTITYMKERIKTLMESQHMTQQVFADFLGINPATLSGIFNDRTKPTLNIVEAVKKKFPDISLEWLMFGTGTMYASAEAVTQQPVPTPSGSAAPATPASQPQTWNQEPVIDFGETLAPAPTPRYAPTGSAHQGGGRTARPEALREEVKIIDKPTRHVTEIRVYYDDQTWESFVPSKK